MLGSFRHYSHCRKTQNPSETTSLSSGLQSQIHIWTPAFIFECYRVVPVCTCNSSNPVMGHETWKSELRSRWTTDDMKESHLLSRRSAGARPWRNIVLHTWSAVRCHRSGASMVVSESPCFVSKPRRIPFT